MEKMAVTGGAGFIGSNLAEHLVSQGCFVLVVDNFSTGKEENLAGWANKSGQVEVLRRDINETDRLREGIQRSPLCIPPGSHPLRAPLNS